MKGPAKPLTGRKVLAILLAAFGTIIGVNLTLAYFAITSFPGLDVKNTYVASQVFDAQRQAQQALGWQVSIDFDDRLLRLEITGKDGTPPPVDRIAATIGRATHARDDQQLFFAPAGDGYITPVALAPGNWQLRLTIFATNGTAFHQRLPIAVGQ